MQQSTAALMTDRRRVNWVRLRTLVMLRWIAIAGQIGAIAVGVQVFGLRIDLGLAGIAIGALVTANIVEMFVYPENTRLSETQVATHLMVDILQLGFLLYISGGLNNPSALLMLVPVTVSAMALRKSTTVVIGTVAIALASFVTLQHLPLVTGAGEVLALPRELLFGFWAATVIGIVFLSAFAQRVTSEIHDMSDALSATQMALAREQKLTDLGGVVAATAHELGTPLATIKLVSTEMLEEIADGELADDLRLIGEQADRCRDILRSMGRAGHDDLHLKQAPAIAVLREAAEPHAERGIDIAYATLPGDGAEDRVPLINRRPEIIHGLRNLIQNAVDFAETGIWIDLSWDNAFLTMRISDDGPGFPPEVLARIGDPFVRSRRRWGARPRNRREYEGMGLGLFIAKTLLERSGAELTFANGTEPNAADRPSERGGAIVEVSWPIGAVVSPSATQRGGLGRNRPVTA